MLLDQSCGRLHVRTGVDGRAARLGHRLTIVMTRWSATVTMDRDRPREAQLCVDVASLDVVRGEGGARRMSSTERALARGNALGRLDSTTYPQIQFVAGDVSANKTGYRLSGALTIHGMTQAHVVDLTTADRGEQVELSCETSVVQTDFGVAPYSLMMGSLRVADTVAVSFAAMCPR